MAYYVWVLFGTLLLQWFCMATANIGSLAPPYTCTTTTTLCQSAEGGEVRPQVNAGPSISQGKPGKRGPTGLKGNKGEQGDPCHCDIADEAAIDDMRRRMQAVEADNANLKRTLSSNSGRLGSVSNPAKSCLHLRQDGQDASGIFSIQVDDTSSPIQVFCDMESAGGGWTLVASVHENNINGKCTQGDLWSSDQGHGNDPRGNKNWENFNTFGTPEGATSADYKSQAYYALQASDMMIWHVPNDVEIRRASEEASLKYRTTTSFLEDYGGNLRSLFDDHFPLERGEAESGSSSLSDVLSALERASPTMRSLVPGFYSYTYDNSNGFNNSITDGGNDMFDGGNKVFYGIGGEEEETWITYNEFYRNASVGIDFVSSSNQHPFHALMWIGNERRTQQTYTIRVLGDAGADGSGSSRTHADTLRNGLFTLTYHAYSVYGASDSSICKVFYYVQSNSWGSIVSSVSRSPWTSGTAGLDHGLTFTGAPKSVLVGYTLLSRPSGGEVTNSYIRAVLNVVFSVLPNKMHEASCGKEADSLVQPVVFLKGNNEQIADGIPQSIKADTSPGFIQFRFRNSDGFPNPLCPGVKTTSCHPESVCVGGMSADEETCGDFSGWQGKRSTDDINSSILIFTRGRE